MELTNIYKSLLGRFGTQGWWPVKFGFQPPELEICTGAVLTQNTAWANVEKALKNLKAGNCTTPDDFLKISRDGLKQLIRPSGFYNQKAERLKLFIEHASSFGSFENFLKKTKREDLLKLKGIGPETADSILLYAANRPCFVVDAYTRRVFSRMGLVDESWDYERIRTYCEKSLPKDTSLYREFHALIVELGKNVCKKRPVCGECPLRKGCGYLIR